MTPPAMRRARRSAAPRSTSRSLAAARTRKAHVRSARATRRRASHRAAPTSRAVSRVASCQARNTTLPRSSRIPSMMPSANRRRPPAWRRHTANARQQRRRENARAQRSATAKCALNSSCCLKPAALATRRHAASRRRGTSQRQAVYEAFKSAARRARYCHCSNAALTRADRTCCAIPHASMHAFEIRHGVRTIT